MDVQETPEIRKLTAVELDEVIAAPQFLPNTCLSRQFSYSQW
jgi:hypothetical protein